MSTAVNGLLHCTRPRVVSSYLTILITDPFSTGPSSASTLLSASPQAFYAQYQPNYFMPFQTMAYGTPWSTSNPVPVSNYSTLNGATTSSATASSSQQQKLQQTQPQQQQSHQPQQHPSSSQQMIIEYVFVFPMRLLFDSSPI